MLKDDDPLLSNDSQPQVIDIETENFSLYERDKSRDKARGPFQIVHGDVARAIGYCENFQYFKLNLIVGVKPMKTPLFAGYLALMVSLSILMVFFIFVMLQKDVMLKILYCLKCVVISV